MGRSAMSNVLAKSTQKQAEGLGRLGWSLRKIETATGVRREKISGYLAAARIPVRRRGERMADWPPANPATTAVVSTDSVPPDAPVTGAATRRCRCQVVRRQRAPASPIAS